jgi:DNA-binding beta-propeller fold protein YncE
VEGLWIDPHPAWGLDGRGLARPEGVAFSRDGRLVALAQSEGNRVSIHVRAAEGGGVETQPACVLEGPHSGIDYPHDVDFSPDGRLLAVANRKGPSLTFYARRRGGAARFGSVPVWSLRGAACGLDYVDGVKFVPPHGRHVAAANLTHSSITFYRRGRWRRSRFHPAPSSVLAGPASGLWEPDGLAFSADGTLLAAANHGAGTVTVYGRRGTECAYGPEPEAVLGGTTAPLRFPHSVAFSLDGTHLAVSDAGGRSVTVFRRRFPVAGPPAWAATAAFALEACDPAAFEATNRENHREGGPKGIAFAAGCFAFCNAYLGLRVHAVHTRAPRPEPATV